MPDRIIDALRWLERRYHIAAPRIFFDYEKPTTDRILDNGIAESLGWFAIRNRTRRRKGESNDQPEIGIHGRILKDGILVDTSQEERLTALFHLFQHYYDWMQHRHFGRQNDERSIDRQAQKDFEQFRAGTSRFAGSTS